MFSKIIGAFSKRSDRASPSYLPESTEASVEEESCQQYDAAIYKINGTAVELMRPQSRLVFTEESLDIYDPDVTKADVSMPYKRICAIRQHRPNTIQFLYRGTASYDCEEFGFHFSQPFVAFSFRSDLLLGLASSTAPILKVCVSVALFDPKTKRFLPWLDKCPMVLARRTEDSLSLLTVYGDDEESVLFQTELTRDVQFFPTVAEQQFTLWGPFVNRGSETQPEMVRSLLLFKLTGDETDIDDVFVILDKVVGYETKIIEFQEQSENFEDHLSGDDDDGQEVMWDDSDETDSLKRGLSDVDEEEEEEEGEEDRPYDRGDSREELSGRCSTGRRHRKSVIESVDPSSMIIEKDPDAKLHRFMQCGDGRSFVCRSTGSTGDPLYWKDVNQSSFDLQVYGKDEDQRGLAFKGSIDGRKFTYKSKPVAPTTGLLHKGERNLLVCDPSDKTGVYTMDLEREKIVSRLDCDELNADLIFSSFKGGQASDDPTFMAANGRAFYLMDSRLAKSNRQHSLSYATNTQFTSACTDEAGHILLGSKLGQLRLYDGEPNKEGKFKIAKTQLDASEGECIKAVDVTPCGSWILATMKTCLVVYPTRLKCNGKTGFETRLGKYKPPGVFLRLSVEDIMKYDLQDIDFQPAVFDQAIQSILTSTGNLAIVWDFKSVKRGHLYNYSIKITNQYIKDSQALNDGSVVVAYPQEIDILGQKKTRRKS